ncbi:MAG: ABC transporter substrate-binding protein [Pseudomonadota bacterium]
MDANPQLGGTLRYYGPGGMDHVDPAAAYYTFSHQMLRLFTRQLFSYPTALDESALHPVPDLAREMPTRSNGGISEDGLRYTITLRPGVYWDTQTPREVTAHDVVRGFKRMCNPVATAGALSFYTTTIAGMADFAAGYREAFPDPSSATASALADFQNRFDIKGLKALDEWTLTIELLRPANDMVNVLAMIFASAAPVEYDEYIPDSPELIRNIRSCGPYRLTDYRPGHSLRMERNPVWRQETDDVRHQYIDAIEVEMEQVSDEQVRAKIQSGGADLSWGAPIISRDRQVLDSDRRLGYALNPYLVFNLHSPNAGGAMQNIEVRRAIAYAINKASMVGILDKMDIGTTTVPANTAIPFGNVGHREYNPYPTPGDRGDPQRSRALLAEAGYGDGLKLRALYRDDTPHDELAEAYAADLRAVGIDVELVFAGPADAYYRTLQDPDRARAGDWDISAPAWMPDWWGNNGRVYLQPMFQSGFVHGTSNYGGYQNPEVDRLIEAALEARDESQADELWHEVDRRVLDDVAIVPVLACEPTIPHMMSARVRNGMPMPHIDRWIDASHLWLDQPEAAHAR